MNKLVIISGSSRGLGSAIAQSFVKDGYKVAINYFKSEDRAKNLVADLGTPAKAFYADVSDIEQVKSMLSAIKKEFGALPSVLVNNAMTAYSFNGDARKTAETITWKEISDHMDVTLKGSLNLIQSLVPSMKDEGYGRVINIGTNLVQNPVVPYHDYTIALSLIHI